MRPTHEHDTNPGSHGPKHVVGVRATHEIDTNAGISCVPHGGGDEAPAALPAAGAYPSRIRRSSGIGGAPWAMTASRCARSSKPGVAG